MDDFPVDISRFASVVAKPVHTHMKSSFTWCDYTDKTIKCECYVFQLQPCLPPGRNNITVRCSRAWMQCKASVPSNIMCTALTMSCQSSRLQYSWIKVTSVLSSIEVYLLDDKEQHLAHIKRYTVRARLLVVGYVRSVTSRTFVPTIS